MPGLADSRKLSSESLNALLLALGLTDSGNTTELSKGAVPVVSTPRFTQKDFFVPQRPTTPFSKLDFLVADESQISTGDFRSEFDIYTEVEEDSDLDPEFLSPQYLDNFEAMSPPAIHSHNVNRTMKLRASSFSSPPPADHIYIKAAHNATIIMLRTPRDIKFAELKRRLYDKFVNQENILLSHSFSVVLALPPSSRPGCKRMSLASCTEMRFIDREADWRKITTANDANKITLRILDTPP